MGATNGKPIVELYHKKHSFVGHFNVGATNGKAVGAAHFPPTASAVLARLVQSLKGAEFGIRFALCLPTQFG